MRKLSVLRGIAVLWVVLAHSTGWAITALLYWEQRFGKRGPVPDLTWLGTPTYYGLILLRQLALFAVPMFLFASGFYVLYAARGKWTNLHWKTIRGWLATLAYPFIVWTAISTILYVLTVAFSPSGRTWDIAGSLAERVQSYFYAPVLAELFALSPLMVWLALKRPVVLLVLSTLLFATDSILHYLTYAGLPVGGFIDVLTLWGWLFIWRWSFFFAAGLVAARCGEAFRVRLARSRRALLVFTALSGLLSMIEADAIYKMDLVSMPGRFNPVPNEWKLSSWVFMTTAVLLIYSFDWRQTRVTRILGRLGLQSYGIYLMQFIALEYATKLIYHVAPELLPIDIVLVPTLVIVGIALPSLLISVVSRSPARRYRRFLFGS